jgi:hypothetical protein
MIKFIIHQAYDLDFVGEHQFLFNRILASPHPQSNLVIKDHGFDSHGFILELTDKGVLSNTLPVGKFYLSNGKKIAGTKLHKSGDKLQFGSIVLEILEHKKETGLVYLPLEKRYEESVKHPYQDSLLELLERELLELEGENESR